MKEQEGVGKTVEEAVEAALKEMGARREDVGDPGSGRRQ